MKIQKYNLWRENSKFRNQVSGTKIQKMILRRLVWNPRNVITNRIRPKCVETCAHNFCPFSWSSPGRNVILSKIHFNNPFFSKFKFTCVCVIIPPPNSQFHCQLLPPRFLLSTNTSSTISWKSQSLKVTKIVSYEAWIVAFKLLKT